MAVEQVLQTESTPLPRPRREGGMTHSRREQTLAQQKPGEPGGGGGDQTEGGQGAGAQLRCEAPDVTS